MSEKMWLILDPDVFRRAELKGIDSDTQNVYLMILLRAMKNPWLAQRPDVVPCDKGILAKATGCEEARIQEALNQFRKLGFVKLIKETEIMGVDSSSSGVPTLEEVQKFAEENAPDVDAQKFYDYYKESEFRYKGKPIDWKAKLTEWQKTEKPTKKAAAKWGAQDFESIYKSKGFDNMRDYLAYVQNSI